MRSALIAVLIAGGIMSAAAGNPARSATLKTSAQVTLICPSRETALIELESHGETTWLLKGQPNERLMMFVEVRNDSGEIIETTADIGITLDDSGMATADLPVPVSFLFHDPLPTITLVFCRE